MIIYKYILILAMLFNSFTDTHREIIKKIESHYNSENIQKRCTDSNLKNIIDNMRMYNEYIELLENDLIELKSIISLCIDKYQKENTILVDSLSKIFYLSRYIKYGIPIKKENYIRYMIILKSILKDCIACNKASSEKIIFLKNLKSKIITKISNIKKNYHLLSCKMDDLALKSKTGKNISSDNLAKIKNISKNICSMKDLINELEIEEYIGVLKNIISDYNFKNKLKFTDPCKYIEKNTTKNLIKFSVKTASKVFAPEDGIIIFIGTLQNQNIIVIKHNKSLKSIIYGDIVNFVNVGDIVHKNQEIAQINDSVHNIDYLNLKIIKDSKIDTPCKYLKN